MGEGTFREAVRGSEALWVVIGLRDEEISDALQDAPPDGPELIFWREEMSQSCRRVSGAEG